MNNRKYLLYILLLSVKISLSQISNDGKYSLVIAGHITLNNPIRYITTDTTTNKTMSFIVEKDRLDFEIKDGLIANKFLYLSNCRFYKIIDDLLFNKKLVLGLNNKTIQAIKKECNTDKIKSSIKYTTLNNELKYSEITEKRFLLCFISVNYILTHASIDENIKELPRNGYIQIVIPY